MKKLGKKFIQLVIAVSLISVLSCELSEKVFIQPTPIALEASEISATRFQANWKPLLGATQYSIDVSTSAGFDNLLEGYPVFTNDTNVVISDLDVNQVYFYRVRANRQGNLTEPSGGIEVRTTNLQAPLATAATNVTSASFKANWEEVGDATSYLAQLSTDPQFGSIEQSLTVTDTNCVVFANLEPEQTYYYQVRAIRGFTVSNFSNIIDTTTLRLQTPLLFPVSDVSPIRFTVSWSAIEGASSYELEVATDPDFTQLIYNHTEPIEVNDTTQEVRLYSVRVGKTHYYRVRAKGNLSTSEYTEIVAVETQTLGDCRIERISGSIFRNTDRQNTFFTYDDDKLVKLSWGEESLDESERFKHEIVYDANDRISQVSILDGSIIREVWVYTYDGEVVAQIDVTDAFGFPVDTKRFEYNDSLQVVRFMRGFEFNGEFQPQTLNLRYTYTRGAWSPSRAFDDNNNGEESWRWEHDDVLSPFVLLDPNLALVMPIVTESGFARPGVPSEEGNRVPFLGVTNLTFVRPPDIGTTTVFQYGFGADQSFPPIKRDGDPSIQETYEYSSGCGF